MTCFPPKQSVPAVSSRPLPRTHEQVLTVPGSTPWPRLSRLISLLESNPETFEQMARQEHVKWSSRSQATSDTNRPEADEDHPRANQGPDQPPIKAGASSRVEDESSGGSLPPALVFVAGDRSQVRTNKYTVFSMQYTQGMELLFPQKYENQNII